MQPLISVENLSIRFRGEGSDGFFLNRISFSIHKGETLGIVGESGSGKSLSSLAIMGLIKSPPAKFESGKIMFFSEEEESIDLLQLKEKAWQKIRGNKIAMIFQEPMTSLNPVLPCGVQVIESLILHENLSKKEAKEKCIDLFNEVQLPRPKE
ncbi:ATP-binding cassette domain-containing protein, partial [Candidatus Venteria ishoeyi]|uniref:ATP-binding cassette domain-containing protein n=1 Tax=Candidatus Venteria ishoeyi TaxID=1899563 RepID=UPI000A69DBCD